MGPDWQIPAPDVFFTLVLDCSNSMYLCILEGTIVLWFPRK